MQIRRVIITEIKVSRLHFCLELSQITQVVIYVLKYILAIIESHLFSIKPVKLNVV